MILSKLINKLHVTLNERGDMEVEVWNVEDLQKFILEDAYWVEPDNSKMFLRIRPK